MFQANRRVLRISCLGQDVFYKQARLRFERLVNRPCQLPQHRALASDSNSVVFQNQRLQLQTPTAASNGNTCTSSSKRFFSSSMSEGEIKKRLDEFQDLFVEARLCIEDATESVGTTYFEEDSEAAREAVQEAVDTFQKLIDEIEDLDEKNRVLRANGLKVEQLKGELDLALKGGHDHH